MAKETTFRLYAYATLAIAARSSFGEVVDIERDGHSRVRLPWFPPSFSDVEGSQSRGLRDLYDATNASACPRFFNWFRPINDPHHTHYCNFTGVTCDRELYVTELNLNETGLTGTLPDSVWNFQRLTVFKVWLNDHIGTIPSAFGALPNLEHLILGQNSLSGTVPWELGNAHMLKRLLIQSNNVIGTIPASLCKLSNLRALDFSRNSVMTGHIPSCLGGLPNLRYIRVRDAGFTGEIPVEVCALSDYGCDGVACSGGSFLYPHGRQTNSSTPCLPCPFFSSFVGRTRCVTTSVPSTSSPEPYSAMPNYIRTLAPSNPQTRNPSAAQLLPPTVDPSMRPSAIPTTQTSELPAVAPSIVPSVFPTSLPSKSSLLHPSAFPSFLPSSVPSTFGPSSTVPSETSLPTSSSSPSLASLPVVASLTILPSSVDLSESPTSESTFMSLSPTSDFVVGGLKQGDFDDSSPAGWSWGLLALILCLATCVLVGLAILSRRRRLSETQQDDSMEAPSDVPDVASSASPHREPVDPFSFPEIRAQPSPYDYQDEGIARLPHNTCVEYTGTVGGRTAGIISVPIRSIPRHGGRLPSELQNKFEMKITPSGIEFVSACTSSSELREAEEVHLPDESRFPSSPTFRSWNEEARELPPPMSITRARHEQRKVEHQKEVYDAEEQQPHPPEPPATETTTSPSQIKSSPADLVPVPGDQRAVK